MMNAERERCSEQSLHGISLQNTTNLFRPLPGVLVGMIRGTLQRGSSVDGSSMDEGYGV
jgi:hypothetical protein